MSAWPSLPWLTLTAAFVLAFLTPVIVIMVRHEVRLRRIRLIDEFSRNFGAGLQRVDPVAVKQIIDPRAKQSGKVVRLETKPEGGGMVPDGPMTTIGITTQIKPVNETPSFEFVKSKYAVDLDTCPANVDRFKLRALDLSDLAVDEYLGRLRWYQLRSNWRILWASTPYVLFCFFGFMIALSPLGPEGPLPLEALISPTFLTSGGLPATPEGKLPVDALRHFNHVVTVAAIAFIGAYLFTLRLFIRSVTVFDLSAITMLRATLHVVLAVAGIVLIYRAMPDLMGWYKQTKPEELAAIASVWFIAAFLFGFVPDSALQFMLTKASQWGSPVKTMDDRFIEQTRSIPLDVIDGIDFATRFRLEEANVFEVQNLACANPIMLHIETPFGIYQTIDWVAQAQLCSAVGPERFLIMRQHNIRTIFDLERAVLAPTATPQMRRFIATLLLMPTEVSHKLFEQLKAKFPGFDSTPPALLEPAALQLYVTQLFGARQTAPLDPDATVIHLVSVIVDDLHVHRLRQIWLGIALQLGYRSVSLNAMDKPEFWGMIAAVPEPDQAPPSEPARAPPPEPPPEPDPAPPPEPALSAQRA